MKMILKGLGLASVMEAEGKRVPGLWLPAVRLTQRQAKVTG